MAGQNMSAQGAAARIPVTVLTGFLGSGKTTLVNRILSEQHGRRIAVIENEFGEVGVDHELVIGAEEEIFETSNGCICCTVRGDLIRILTQLLKRRDRFDSILIETTGLADPGPVAQTFFIEEDLKEHFALDAIVTLVDARHIEQQLADNAIALEQIAFGDVLVLNKIDLADAATLARVEQALRAINPTARLLPTRKSQVPLASVLDVGAFDLTRALARDDAFLEPTRPFEWVGVYALPPGRYALHAGEHAHGHGHEHGHEHAGRDDEQDHDHDHAPGLVHVDVVALPLADEAALDSLLEAAERLFAAPPVDCHGGDTLQPGRGNRLHFGAGAEFLFEPPGGTLWALFAEHAPEEFGFHVHGSRPRSERRFGSHHHDLAVSSIGLEDERALDAHKVNDWLSYLLQSRGQDILRMKGVLNLRGEARRYVFHGVHMVFDGQLERPWNGERRSRLVFIGRNLDRREIEAGFESCVA
jgi:G3E family GTPase